MNRRQFLGGLLAAAAVGGVHRETARAAEGQLPRRPLGRTGVMLPILGLGGAHIGHQPHARDSIRIIRAAIDGGITFLDNSWDYNQGQSEIRMGQALGEGYRDRVFLMTKLDGRDRASAQRQLDESLRRLRTDHVDLLQFHEVIWPGDPGRIFAPGGAMETFLAARRAGKTRFLGFTGHKSPEIHLEMLRAWEAHGSLPDAVQMPLNVLDAGYDSFQARVLPELVRRNIGVLGMKPLGDGFVLKSKVVRPQEGLRYAMSVPGVSVTITGIDSMEILDQAFRVARGFEPLDEHARRALESQSARVAASGQFEAYKTSHTFDSTYYHPEWMG
jgi:aryl-alcohol dehydrogenase-like predicted oxidoreductase